MSVPLFFAISGAILLQQKSPKNSNFLKILINLLLYSAISCLYIFLRGWPSVVDSIYNIINKPVFYHLWFFYYMIPLYIIMSVVRAREVHGAQTLIMISILFIVFNPQIGNIFFQGKIHGNRFMLDGEFIFYLMYGVAGTAIANYQVKGKRHRRTLLLSAFFSLLLSVSFIALGTMHSTVSSGKFHSPLYNYTSIPVFIASISTLFLFRFSELPKLINAIFVNVGNYSLAIFGIHAIFLDIILRSGLRDFSRPIADITMTFLIVTLGSYAFSIVVARLSPWPRIL